MKKIAIIRRNGLGDLLCAFPLIRFFQKTQPETHLTLFVDPRNAPLVPYLPPVDQVVVFPNSGNKYLNLWKTARAFRKTFDLAISAKTSPMKLMNFFLHWLKAQERLAYVDSSWHSRFINRPFPYDALTAKNQHQALKSLKMVAPQFDSIPEELYPRLHVPLTKKPFHLLSPVFLISASTMRAASRLDEERYAALLNRLHMEDPISVVVIGQKRDEKRAKQIAAHLKAPHFVHFPRNFDEFMLFLNAVDFYFVGDGGVAHIGAGLNKEGLVLYGETTPNEWRPLSNKMETLYHPTHVNYLKDEAIYQALKRIRNRGRDNRDCRVERYSSQPLSTPSPFFG